MQLQIQYEPPQRLSRAPAPKVPGVESAFGLSVSTNPDALPKGPRCKDGTSKHSFLIYADSAYAEVRSRLPSSSRPATRGNRRAITGFSSKSRLALKREFSKLSSRHRSRCLFLTLTYHQNMTDGRRAKMDFEAFDKALLRQYPENGCIWKMEAQKRGAIHYHLLVFGVRFIPHQWLAEVWGRIVSHGEQPDAKQISAGTQVVMAESAGSVGIYLEKYVSKVLDDDELESINSPGRYWGLRRMGQFQGERFDVPISRDAAVEISRTLDKLKKSQILSAWRERGKWNKSIGRVIDSVRSMLPHTRHIDGGKFSSFLHRLQCSRRRSPESLDIGYEHCWMVKWARRRKKKTPFQKSVWQVTLNHKTSAQLLFIALSL